MSENSVQLITQVNDVVVVGGCMYKSGFIVVTAQSTYNTERHLNKYFLHYTKFQNKSLSLLVAFVISRRSQR